MLITNLISLFGRKIMIKAGIVPGSAFCELEEGFVRLSIVALNNEIVTGFRKFVKWADD
jgi:hypothetical protein